MKMNNIYTLDDLTILHEYFTNETNELGESIKVKVVICKEKEKAKIKEKVKGHTYTESQKESNKRYVNNNRDKVYKYISCYVKNRCEEDPEYHEKIKEQKRAYYHRKKEKKLKESENE